MKNLSSQLAKIDIAQQKKEESEKAKVWDVILSLTGDPRDVLLASPACLQLLIKCQFDEQSPYQASIIQKLKEAEERKKSIETERLVLPTW